MSWGYGAAVALRNFAFDAGIFKARSAGVPVVAVGNMTAGGTGKTPVVELILRLALRQGVRPGVVSRGYGRASTGVVIVADGERVRADAAAGGDEPVQIARKFPGVPVVVGERRHDAAVTAVGECGVQLIVSDDGFQHRWLQRECDIVVVDAAAGLEAEPMLPAGMRREPMRGLKRAHVVALTGVADSEEAAARTRELRRWFDGPVVTIGRSFEAIHEPAAGKVLPVAVLDGAMCFCFSAIGNPARFVADLSRAGARVAGEHRFRDHHRFTADELRAIVMEARRAGAEVLVTTEKDLARMSTDGDALSILAGSMRFWVPVLTATEAGGDVLGTRVAELAKGMR